MKLPGVFRKSFSKRLILVLLLVSIAPLLFFCAIIIHNSGKKTNEDYRENNRIVLENFGRRLDDYMDQMEESLFSVVYNDYTNSNNEDLDIYSNIQQQLLYIRFSIKETESLLYYFPERKEVYIINNRGNRSYLNAEDIEETDWYKQAVQANGKCVILSRHYQSGYDSRYEIIGDVEVFTICRTFRLLNGELSVLAVNSKMSDVEKLCGESITTKGESVTCLTENGEMLWSTDEKINEESDKIAQKILEQGGEDGHFIMTSEIDGDTYTYVYRVSKNTGLISFKRISNAVLNEYAAESIRTLLIIVVGILVLVVLIGTLFARTVTKPLRDLEKTMGEFGDGNVRVRASVSSEDEIGKIAEAFNSMAGQIRYLIKEQYSLRLSTRTAQLYSLIAQINPHFINNVLQSIGSVALEKDAPDIYEITTIFARMLRYSIKGKEMVALSDEIQNALDYLFIQKFRYEDLLKYEILTDENLRNTIVPKLILQPLIENAIVHGLEEKKGIGTVKVSCITESPEMMKIIITDNGCGIAGEKVEEFQKIFQQRDREIELETESIGILNVYQRLRIIYGSSFMMEIHSKLMCGTVIKLHIPVSDGRKTEDVKSNSCR